MNGKRLKLRLDPEIAEYVAMMLDELAASEPLDGLRYQRFTATAYWRALNRAQEADQAAGGRS